MTAKMQQKIDRSEDNMANRTENDKKSNAKTGTPHDATIKSYVRTFENYKTMLQINIMDYDTETELDGVKYSIVDSKGEIVQEAVSIHGNNVLIRGAESRRNLSDQGDKGKRRI